MKNILKFQTKDIINLTSFSCFAFWLKNLKYLLLLHDVQVLKTKLETVYMTPHVISMLLILTLILT